MVDQDGAIFLTDFGIARHAASTTTTVGVAGTHPYMAPEQIRGDALTAATDIYALGVVMFELLTGRWPFLGNELDTDTAGAAKGERIRYAHLHIPAPDPRSINPAIPAELASAINRALEKAPEKRFASAQEFFTACCAAAGYSAQSIPDRFPVSSHRTDEVAKASVTLPDDPSKSDKPVIGESSRKFRERQRWVIAGIAIIALLLVAGVIAGIGYPLPFIHTPTSTEPLLVYLPPTQTPIPAASTSLPPTKTPIPPAATKAAPTKPVPRMYDFVSCAESCDGTNQTSVFAERTTKISARWRYENIPVGASYTRFWTMDGKEWVRYNCNWPGPANGIDTVTLTEPGGLHSGTWEMTIKVNGIVLLKEQMEVEGNWTYWSPAGTFNTCYGKK